ncbi:MAG: hypothetical protein FWG07_04530 [Treponema sp.]|nr:hypothetical protein [Treponema sp.]
MSKKSLKIELKIYSKTVGILVLIYAFFLMIIIISNIFTKEIYGEIVNEHNYLEKIVWFHKGQYSSEKMPKEEDVLRKDVYYKYIVNDNEYINKRITNIIIFPNNNFTVGEKIKVYYNKYFPKYSILYKWNALYFILNCIPLILLICIYFLLRRNI